MENNPSENTLKYSRNSSESSRQLSNVNGYYNEASRKSYQSQFHKSSKNANSKFGIDRKDTAALYDSTIWKNGSSNSHHHPNRMNGDQDEDAEIQRRDQVSNKLSSNDRANTRSAGRYDTRNRYKCNGTTKSDSRSTSKAHENEKLAARSTAGRILDVCLTCKLSSNQYYVMEKRHKSTIKTISETPRTPLKFAPNLNSVYLSVYDNVACRVKIIEKESLFVHFIDYGNYEKIERNELYELPAEFRWKKPMAFRITLAPGHTRQLAEMEEITIKETYDGLWEIIEQEVEQHASPEITTRIEKPITSDTSRSKNRTSSGPAFHQMMKKEKAVADNVKNDNEFQILKKNAEDIPMKPETTSVQEKMVLIDRKIQNHETASERQNVSSKLVPTAMTNETILVEREIRNGEADSEAEDVSVKTEITQIPNEMAGEDVQKLSNDEIVTEDSTKDSRINFTATPNKTDSIIESPLNSELEVGKAIKVTIISHGVGYGSMNVYRVICSEKKAAYEQLMKMLKAEGELFDSCDKIYEVGGLYAIERENVVYRVRVIGDCPTCMEYIDDPPLNHLYGFKTMEDMFEEEDLLKLPAKYSQKDLLPFSIPYCDNIRPPDGTELIIVPKEQIHSNLWSVDLLDDGSDYVWIETGNIESAEDDVPDDEYNSNDCTEEEDTTHVLEGCDSSLTDVVDLEDTEENVPHATISETVERDNKNVDVELEEGVIFAETKNLFESEASFSNVILEAHVPCNVTVVGSIGDKMYKVICTRNKTVYNNLIKKMEAERDSTFSALNKKYQVGDVCAIFYRGIARRVRVLCVDPLCVGFIDGKVDKFVLSKIHPDKLLKLPERYADRNLMPFTVTFDSVDRLEIGREIIINPEKLVGPAIWYVRPMEDEHVFNFETFGCDFQSNLPDALDLPHTITDALIGESATFIPAIQLNENCISGMFVPTKLKKELTSLNRKMENLSPDPDFRPEVGEVVMAFLNEMDSAARVSVLKTPTLLFPQYSVFCIDLGYVTTCERNAFTRMPVDFLRVPITSSICTVLDGDGKNPLKGIELAVKYRFETKLVDTKLGNCIGFMAPTRGTSPGIEVKFEKLVQPMAGSVLEHVPLKSGDRVELIKFGASNRVYIRPKDAVNDDRRIEIIDMVNLTVSQDPLKEDPLKNDMVAVKYAGCWWRAEVLGKEREQFLVVLVDKGCELSVPRNDMTSLPTFLKSPFRTAVPVTLKNVRIAEVDLKNKEFLNFLNTEYEFELVIEDDTTVQLKFLKNEYYEVESHFTTANEYIDECLTPFWLVCLKTGQYYEPMVITFGELPILIPDYGVGQTLTLFVAGILDKDTLSVCNKNSRSSKIFAEMNVEKRLEEYCSHVKSPYRPRENEVCVAKSKSGVWHRAVCLYFEPGEKLYMQFLDAGDLEWVHHTDVRRFETEFALYPVCARMVKLSNADAFDVDELVGCEWRFEMISVNEVTLLNE